MPDIGFRPGPWPEPWPDGSAHPGALARRLAVWGAVLAGAALGVLATPGMEAASAAHAAGAELVGLLRAMAGLKMLFAAAMLAALHWRLAWAAPRWRLLCYATAVAAMAAGPVLIWQMAHVALGAALLHGGLLAGVLLLWRDPVVGARLSDLVARRRLAIRLRG